MFTNSPLVSYTRISPNKTPNRNHAIDTVTIHCIVGQWTAKQGCDYFATTNRKCSANYVVGKDGSIGLSVEEKDRSWCSSSASNDNRAITIEVASDTTHPYKVTDAAYQALITLLADICKRNGIKSLRWKADKSLIGKVEQQNMTVHRWFAPKACPGDYLYNLHGQIAAEVNKRLGVSGSTAPVVTPSKSTTPYRVRVKIKNLNIRKGPGTQNASNGFIAPGVYTIVSESKGSGASMWGKLKSGAGWISLDYCEKLSKETNMITCRQKGDFSKLTRFLERAKETVHLGDLNQYGRAGVAALASATPVDSGETAQSWYYEITNKKGFVSISFHNSNIQNGVPIAIILQYGHGTGTGGWVAGRDYINPAIRPIFDQIANDAWKEVTKT